jgi:hypothetical protein
MRQPLRISLSPNADDQPAARYALQFAALSLGVRCEFVDAEAEADLHYGEVPRTAAAFVPYWAECYDPAEPHVGVRVADDDWWVPARRADDRPVDVVGGIARLLVLLDEAQVAESDRGADGVFMVSALPTQRRAHHASPLVDWHVAELGRLLRASGVDIGPGEDRWPHRARYAVVLTHDTDAAGLHDVRELLRTAVRAVRYRSVAHVAAAMSAALGWFRGSPDPQFAFTGWAGLERAIGVRSAFYLHARDGGRRHLHDPTYRVDGHQRWAVLAELADEGWEIGIHAAIESGRSVASLARERELLEAVVRRPVRGLRHHYWRLDWRFPWRTFRNHSDAGYTYDTSMAWRDRPGFRAGTAQPYRPFDPERGVSLGIVELPTTAMDGHLFECLRLSPADAVNVLRDLSGVVRDAGGVVNLNWHQETFGNRHAHHGWRDAYETIVRELADDPDAWVATPHDVARWFLERERRLGYGVTANGKELPAGGGPPA